MPDSFYHITEFVLKNIRSIKLAEGSLKNIFQNELNKKFYLNRQQMPDSFYHITEFRKSNLKNKGPKHIHFAIFWNCCVG